MANDCFFKAKVKGTKIGCLSFTESLCTDFEVISKTGKNSNYELFIKGDIKYPFAMKKKPSKKIEPLDSKILENETFDSDEYCNKSLIDKSLLFSIEILCSFMDYGDFKSIFVHYNQGEYIKDSVQNYPDLIIHEEDIY